MICLPVSLATLLARYSSGRKDDRVAFQRFDHRGGVARGTADIGLGFHVRIGVHIGHHRHAGEARLERAHIGGGDAGGQRAARILAGRSTVLVGLRILAVSAMNLTPQKTMISLSVWAARRLSSSESPLKSVTEWYKHRFHVIVAQDYRIPGLSSIG